MTADEAISVARLIKQVDEMAKEMVTQTLFKSELTRIDNALNTHVEYTKDAFIAEAKRLNAIREVDATAVKVANDRAVEQAALLANQLRSDATTLRELVATTAAVAAKAQAELFAPLVIKLQRVEDKQNEDRGAAKYTDPMLTDLAKKMDVVVTSLSENKVKESYTDPMLTQLIERMEAVGKALTLKEGKGLGAAALWGYIVGGLGLIYLIINIIHAIGV